ncbi:MAG: ATP-dependent DNA helicase RecG [Candidatus Limimorpha sp.]
MEVNLLHTKIEYMKGVGARRAELLHKELNVYTYRDMLNQFPFRYIDKSQIHKVSQVCDDVVYYQLIGTISDLKPIGAPRATRATACFTDETGSIEIVWFRGLKWLKTKFKPGVRYVLFGKASEFNRRFNFVHPEIEEYNPDDPLIGEGLQGVYFTTEKMKDNGLGTRQIAKMQKLILQQMFDVIPEVLPPSIISRENLIPRRYAYYQIHLPSNNIEIQQATRRLKFEEHFFFQLKLLRNKKRRENTVKGHVFGVVGDYFNTFYKDYLPFPLTNAQKRVIREIRRDLGSGHQMNRLLQGDVGSGKTIVALMVMLLALDNGFQACMMAPTEILATQHYATLKEQLKDMPVRFALLTGSTKTAERRAIHQGLKEGSLQILVGTHALIEKDVVFNNLGLAIIDEQHRFGVEQRSKFWEKTEVPPHTLVMTATPIPRTLAMTQYGELDVSKIDELPPGRKPVKTFHVYSDDRYRLMLFMKQQIELGRQVYVVYPLIKESEKTDMIALQEGYEALLRDFPDPQYRICVCHGQLKPEDKDFEMQRFIDRDAQIMVATTVIEVGVNVPNASVMIIENANRFGLSQLHQLRGRVGRGADQSYCILVTDHKMTDDGRIRMKTMCSTNDGFEIAEVDLELRGPGETGGTRQSGQVAMLIGDLQKDGELIQHTRAVASDLLDEDPYLIKPENRLLREHYKELFAQTFDWSQIG